VALGGNVRDPSRIDRILEKLGREWKKFPDMRLGQLLFVLMTVWDDGKDVFYYEDDRLERALNSGGIRTGPLRSKAKE
jgi:hypothetical protein